MRLRKAMLSSTLQENATLLLAFVTGIAIAHLLTPRQIGSYSIAIATVNVVAAWKDSALASYVVSSPELDTALLRASFGLSLAIAACLAVLLFGLSFPLADFYRDPALGHSIRIVALAQFGSALAFPANVCLMRAMRFGSLLAVGVAAATSQSLISITLAALQYGATALAWGYFAASAVTAVMTIACRPDVIRLRPTLSGSRGILGFGGWTLATLFVDSIASSGPDLMIGRALGIGDVALFARAQNLVSFVRRGLVWGMARPLLPSLGQRESEGLSLVPLYQRLVETITGVTWPAYAVLAIWAEPLVRTIYGEAWSAAGTMMMPIAIAHALMLGVPAHSVPLIVKRRQRLLFACELAAAAFTIVALAIGLTLGITGAVWSLVLSGAFVAICCFIVVKSVLEVAPSALFKAWSRSLGLTFVVIPVPLAFRYLITEDSLEILGGFAASSAISAVLWIAAVLLIRHELSLHISGLIEGISFPSRLAALPELCMQPKETDRG
jgi:O-antigen/teichoic acid export membrane protein